MAAWAGNRLLPPHNLLYLMSPKWPVSTNQYQCVTSPSTNPSRSPPLPALPPPPRKQGKSNPSSRLRAAHPDGDTPGAGGVPRRLPTGKRSSHKRRTRVARTAPGRSGSCTLRGGDVRTPSCQRRF